MTAYSMGLESFRGRGELEPVIARGEELLQVEKGVGVPPLYKGAAAKVCLEESLGSGEVEHSSEGKRNEKQMENQ